MDYEDSWVGMVVCYADGWFDVSGVKAGGTGMILMMMAQVVEIEVGLGEGEHHSYGPGGQKVNYK